MPWYDPPTDPNDPNTSYLGQNPAIRDAMLAFGTQLLMNARKPGMAGVGEGLQAGFNTWAGRREQYMKEAREAKTRQNLLARQQNPIGLPIEGGGASLMGAYDTPGPHPSQLQSGPGTNLYYPESQVPTPEAMQGMPPQSPAGPAASPAPQLPPGAAPPPMGPGIQPPAAPPRGPAPPMLHPGQQMGYPPTLADVQSRPSYTGYTPAPPRGLLDYSQGGPYPTGPFEGGAGADTLGGGADQDVLAADQGFRTRMGRSEDASGRAIQYTKGQPYIGKYQMGMPRLKALGFADKDGNMTIPGHPEIKTIQDFANSPEAQEQVATGHFAKVDEEIRANGLDKYIGQTVGGVPVDQNALRGMIHLGGATGTRNFLESGGRDNAGDRFGTRIGDYGRKFAGSQGQAVMQGGAEKDVPQPPAPMSEIPPGGGPDWKVQQGLLDQADASDGLYTKNGQFTEDAKRTLTYALDAGGTEGFQQALMTLVQQKPETFGTAETGLFMKHWNGRVERLTAPKALDQKIHISADQPELLQKAGLPPPPSGKVWEYNIKDGASSLVGDKPEETFTNIGADPKIDPKTKAAVPPAPTGFTWQQKSNGDLSLVGAKPDDLWEEVSNVKGVRTLRNPLTKDMKTVGAQQHNFTLIKDPVEAAAAIGPAYQPGMLVQRDEDGKYYTEKGGELWRQLNDPKEAAEKVGASNYDPKAMYQENLATGKVEKTGGVALKQDVPVGQVGLDYLRREAGTALTKGSEAVSKGRQAFDFFSPNYEMLKTAALTNASTTGVGQPYLEYGKSWVNWIGGKFGFENISGQTNSEVLRSAIAKMMQEVKPEGAGIISDFEDRKYLEHLPGIEKSPMANYIIAESMRRMVDRNAWYQSLRSKYFMGQEDPNNPKEARGHFEGFDDWLYQKDASGHRPVDDKPAMFYTWDQMKAMSPADKTAKLVEGTPYLNKDNQWDIIGRKPVQ